MGQVGSVFCSFLLFTTVLAILHSGYLNDAHAQVSANPALIAFVSDRDGNNEIYIMNPDGSNQTRLTDNSVDDISPTISSDGKRIAFVRDGAICIMNSDGTGIIQLTDDAAHDDLPEWSQDASKIAFVRDGDIYVMNSDGTGLIQLTDDAADDTNPTWLYNAVPVLLAFASNRDGNYEIYRMNADGSSQTRLTNNFADDMEPTWSADGTAIAFTTFRNGNADIYGIDASGGNEGSIVSSPGDDQHPSWGPENDMIAFQSNRDGDEEVYVIGVCIQCDTFFTITFPPTNLTTNSAQEISPDFGNKPQAPPVEEPRLTINAVSTDDSVRHMWTIIRLEGSVVHTGFTPLTFVGSSGSTYSITVTNYLGTVFDHWEDDSTSRTRTIVLTSDNTITAFYDKGDALRGFTSLTYTGTTVQPDLTVDAVSLDGSKTLHLWTIINPQTSDASGTTYTVIIHNYKDRVFDHWEDGSTNPTRVLTIQDNKVITAYYNIG